MSKTTTAHDDDDGYDVPFDDTPGDPWPIPPTGWDTGGPGFPGWPNPLQPHPSWSTSNDGVCIGLFSMGLVVTIKEDSNAFNWDAVITQTMATTCFTKRVTCKNGQSMVHTMNGDPRSPLGKRANRSGNFLLIANGGPIGPNGTFLPWPQLLGPFGEYGGWPSIGGLGDSNEVFEGNFNYTFFLGCCKSSGCPTKAKAKSFRASGSVPKSSIGPMLDPTFPPYNDPRQRAADIVYVQMLQQFGPEGAIAKPKFPRCCSSVGTTFGGSRG